MNQISSALIPQGHSSITLTMTGTLGNAPEPFVWRVTKDGVTTTAEGTAVPLTVTVGDYSINGRSGNGACSQTFAMKVTQDNTCVPSASVIEGFYSPVTDITTATPVTFFISNFSNLKNVFINFGTGPMPVSSSSVVHTFTTPGIYNVYIDAQDKNCSATLGTLSFIGIVVKTDDSCNPLPDGCVGANWCVGRTTCDDNGTSCTLDTRCGSCGPLPDACVGINWCTGRTTCDADGTSCAPTCGCGWTGNPLPNSCNPNAELCSGGTSCNSTGRICSGYCGNGCGWDRSNPGVCHPTTPQLWCTGGTQCNPSSWNCNYVGGKCSVPVCPPNSTYNPAQDRCVCNGGFRDMGNGTCLAIGAWSAGVCTATGTGCTASGCPGTRPVTCTVGGVACDNGVNCWCDPATKPGTGCTTNSVITSYSCPSGNWNICSPSCGESCNDTCNQPVATSWGPPGSNQAGLPLLGQSRNGGPCEPCTTCGCQSGRSQAQVCADAGMYEGYVGGTCPNNNNCGDPESLRPCPKNRGVMDGGECECHEECDKAPTCGGVCHGP